MSPQDSPRAWARHSASVWRWTAPGSSFRLHSQHKLSGSTSARRAHRKCLSPSFVGRLFVWHPSRVSRQLFRGNALQSCPTPHNAWFRPSSTQPRSRTGFIHSVYFKRLTTSARIRLSFIRAVSFLSHLPDPPANSPQKESVGHRCGRHHGFFW